jgi:tRNA pseudouridine38-40 synthase
MTRIALGLEYDGTDFVGWQTQRGARSVQSEMNVAVGKVADGPILVHGSGRTDAGVHAVGQVAHFDTAAHRTPRQWLLGINANLPEDVAVRWVRAVPRAFDARRSALARRYRYRVIESAVRPVLSRRYVWWLRDALDCAAMNRAAAHWLGEHDFSAFRAAGCQSRTPMRRLMSVAIYRVAAEVNFEFTANAFLQHMVRNFVGVLTAIGRGEAPPEWAAEVLAGRDRTRGGVAAPPHGLSLVEVTYPDRYGLPLARSDA